MSHRASSFSFNKQRTFDKSCSWQELWICNQARKPGGGGSYENLKQQGYRKRASSWVQKKKQKKVDDFVMLYTSYKLEAHHHSFHVAFQMTQYDMISKASPDLTRCSPGPWGAATSAVWWLAIILKNVNYRCWMYKCFDKDSFLVWYLHFSGSGLLNAKS